MSKKEYVATFTTSVQISEDYWDVINPSLKVTPETTVKEIFDFQKKYNVNSESQIVLIPLENTPTNE